MPLRPGIITTSEETYEYEHIFLRNIKRLNATLMNDFFCQPEMSLYLVKPYFPSHQLISETRK